MTDSSKYRAPALEKGLDILELLASSSTALSQSEIAKALGRSTNENYRMLDTLLRRNYVARTPEGDRYQLSLKMMVLANAHPPRRRLLDIAEPLMRKVSLASEQSSHLAIWEDGDLVIVATFSAPGNWRLSLRTGSVIGVYNTGSGHVLAAFQNEITRDKMLAEHKLVKGEEEIPRKKFFKKLAQLRTERMSAEPSQTVRGAINLSFPILDPEGNAIAALTCPFLERIDDYKAPDVEQTKTLFRNTAHEIGKQINGI